MWQLICCVSVHILFRSKLINYLKSVLEPFNDNGDNERVKGEVVDGDKRQRISLVATVPFAGHFFPNSKTCVRASKNIPRLDPTARKARLLTAPSDSHSTKKEICGPFPTPCYPPPLHGAYLLDDEHM